MRIDPRFDRNYTFLQERFNQITITKEDFSLLYTISKSNIDTRIIKGINIPNYIRLSAAKNSSIRFNIVDLACYMTGMELDNAMKHTLLYNYLYNKYGTVILTRKIFAYELKISLGTLSTHLKKNKDYLPIFQKGKKKNSPVYFNISDVADYLLKTVKTL